MVNKKQTQKEENKMSAYKVTDGEIQYVAEIIKGNAPSAKEISLEELVLVLDFYNELSLAVRYGDKITSRDIELIEINPSWKNEDQAYNSLRHYNYQSCESQSYANSQVDKWIKEAQEAVKPAIANLADPIWGIETEQLTRNFNEVLAEIN